MILDNKRICLDKKEIKKDANIRDTNTSQDLGSCQRYRH